MLAMEHDRPKIDSLVINGALQMYLLTYLKPTTENIRHKTIFHATRQNSCAKVFTAKSFYIQQNTAKDYLTSFTGSL